MRVSEAGLPMFSFSQITSTNDVARRLVKDGTIDGDAVIVADSQTAGKGRKRRDWISPSGGLWLTRVMTPRLRRERWPLYSFLAGVAAVRAIEAAVELTISLKWPNDLIFKYRKMGGILSETADGLILVGLGINLAVSWPEKLVDSDLPPVNLCAAAGLQPRKWRRLRDALLSRLNREMDRLHRQTDAEGEMIVNCWRQHCDTLSARIDVRTERGCICGTAVDVDADGSLLLRKDGGELISLYAGDVSISSREVTGEREQKRGGQSHRHRGGQGGSLDRF